MPHASYSLRRLVWPIWKWEADFRSEAAASGYSLSKKGARWAARGWLRERRGWPADTATAQAAADPKAMAADADRADAARADADRADADRADADRAADPKTMAAE